MRFFTSTSHPGIVTVVGACCAGLVAPIAWAAPPAPDTASGTASTGAAPGPGLSDSRALLLNTTPAGARLDADSVRRRLDAALAADAPPAGSALQSLRPLGAGRYALTLACADEATCDAALSRLAGLGDWIASIEPDRTVRRPHAPTPRDRSAR
jgi:hypothetical protein